LAALNILETTGLTKVYGGISANMNVDFQLTSGKITALIGPNGAGKSTFVGMVSGRIEATMGRVMFDGKDVSQLPAHKRIQLGIAYTFQITSVFSGLSVHENVALAGAAYL
jgi:branched-chain amino acid transport system ATP-binding protein